MGRPRPQDLGQEAPVDDARVVQVMVLELAVRPRLGKEHVRAFLFVFVCLRLN